MKKSAYFLSDFHLGAKCFDNPLDAEKRVVRFLDSIKDTAAEIYLMGDILDYWYEYRCVVPRGFTRFFGKLAELSYSGVKIFWFIGNHDIWIFDYLPSELGIHVIDGHLIKEIMGHRFFLAHGDGEGHRKLSFRFIRALFRNRFCQVLYSSIHPRWTIPFAHMWSYQSRRNGIVVPDKALACRHHLFRFAADYAASHPDIEYFIFGHLHVLADEVLPSGAHYVVLGDWITQYSYAVFDGDTLSLCHFND